MGKLIYDKLKQQSKSFNVGDDDSDSSDYEFIDDATPGPGSY